MSCISSKSKDILNIVRVLPSANMMAHMTHDGARRNRVSAQLYRRIPAETIVRIQSYTQAQIPIGLCSKHLPWLLPKTQSALSASSISSFMHIDAQRSHNVSSQPRAQTLSYGHGSFTMVSSAVSPTDSPTLPGHVDRKPAVAHSALPIISSALPPEHRHIYSELSSHSNAALPIP